MWSYVELVAVLIVVTAVSVYDFTLANILYPVLTGRFVGEVQRELEVIAIADALLLIADRADPERGNALVRIDARLIELGHRQTAAVGCVRHIAHATDTLPGVANRVCRPVRTIIVGVTRLRKVSHRYYRTASSFVDNKMFLALADLFGTVAIGKVIVVGALLVIFTFATELYRFVDTLLFYPAREKPVLADAPTRLLVTKRIRNLAWTLTTDLIGHSINQWLALGTIAILRQVSAPAVLLYTRGIHCRTAKRFTVVIARTRQIHKIAGSCNIRGEHDQK